MSKRSNAWIAENAERRFLAAIRPGSVPERRPDLGACLETAVADIQAGRRLISEAAQEIGCNQNYLGRRVWNLTKKIVAARDGGKCLMCLGESGAVHHRVRRGMGGARDPLIAYGLANCISICNFCHDYVHSHPEQAYLSGYLLHTWDDPEKTPLLIKPGSVYMWLRSDGSFERCGEIVLF